METKAVVVAKDGVARIGKDIIELDDLTSGTFETNDLASFISKLETLIDRQEGAEEFEIYYNDQIIVANPRHIFHHSVAIAKCVLQTSDPLIVIKKHILCPLVLSALESFLFITKKFSVGTECKDLYDRSRNFQLKKITHMERKVDKQGNFKHVMERVGDANDVEPIEKVSFEIPIFDMFPDTVIISLDVEMKYKESEDGVIVTHSFTNPFLEEELRQARKKAIEGALESLPVNKFWGTFSIIKQNDSWKYQLNGV